MNGLEGQPARARFHPTLRGGRSRRGCLPGRIRMLEQVNDILRLSSNQRSFSFFHGNGFAGRPQSDLAILHVFFYFFPFHNAGTNGYVLACWLSQKSHLAFLSNEATLTSGSSLTRQIRLHKVMDIVVLETNGIFHSKPRYKVGNN